MAGYTGLPHPEYPNMVWSDPQVEGLILAAIEKADTPDVAAKAIVEAQATIGYDSMDREMAFWIATQTKGWNYDDLYDTWLNS